MKCVCGSEMTFLSNAGGKVQLMCPACGRRGPYCDSEVEAERIKRNEVWTTLEDLKDGRAADVPTEKDLEKIMKRTDLPVTYKEKKK